MDLQYFLNFMTNWRIHQHTGGYLDTIDNQAMAYMWCPIASKCGSICCLSGDIAYRRINANQWQ